MNSEKLPITGPCPIDLDAIGFDRKSKTAHCAHCDKSVHNLSNMTKAEVRVFLKENAGRKLCVSYSKRGDAIQFKPAPPPPPQVVPLSRVRASAVGLAVALAACTPHGANETRPTPTSQIQKVDQTKRTVDEDLPVFAGMMPIREPDPEPVEGEIEVPEPDPEPSKGEVKVPDPEPIEELAGEVVFEPEQRAAGAVELPAEPCDRDKGGA